MASQVTIVSNARLMIGDSAISDMSEDTTGVGANLYPSLRNDILRSHPWNCALARVILSPEVEVPAFDYTSQFLLPGDFLRAISVGEAGYEIPFSIESGKVLVNDTVCRLTYIFRNEVESTWDSMLITAMELAMAARMAYARTQSTALRDSLMQELELHMKKTRAVNGMEKTPSTFGDFPLVQARFGSFNEWRR